MASAERKHSREAQLLSRSAIYRRLIGLTTGAANPHRGGRVGVQGDRGRRREHGGEGQRIIGVTRTAASLRRAMPSPCIAVRQ